MKNKIRTFQNTGPCKLKSNYESDESAHKSKTLTNTRKKGFIDGKNTFYQKCLVLERKT